MGFVGGRFSKLSSSLRSCSGLSYFRVLPTGDLRVGWRAGESNCRSFDSASRDKAARDCALDDSSGVGAAGWTVEFWRGCAALMIFFKTRRLIGTTREAAEKI